MPTKIEYSAIQLAAAANVRNKWGSVMYNVLDNGLVGDGVTDDTAALQTLINTAIAAGRKNILFPHTSTGGEYYVTALTDDDQVYFAGDNASFVGGYSGTISDMFSVAELEAEFTNLQTNVMDRAINVKYPPAPFVAATGDGVTDDTAAIQAIIDYLALLGGGIVFLPYGIYNISTTLLVTTSNIRIIGLGADGTHDVGTSHAATEFQWVGASGGTLIKFSPVSGASNQLIYRSGIQGVWLTGLADCDIGLEIRSCKYGRFEDLYLSGFTAHCIYVNVVASLGEARDTQANTFKNINFRQHTTVPEGNCITLDGDITANTSFNFFENIDGSHKDGVFLDIIGTDNNLFTRCRANRASGGAGTGVILRAGADSARSATSNYFVHLSAGAGGVSAEGTETGEVYASNANNIIFYDVGNGAPLPVIGTGAILYYQTEENIFHKAAVTQLSAGNNLTNAEAARDAMTSESLYILNTSSNHIRISDGTSIWGINMSGGSLQIVRLAGTGSFKLPSTTQFNAQTITKGAADSGGAGFAVLRVPN